MFTLREPLQLFTAKQLPEFKPPSEPLSFSLLVRKELRPPLSEDKPRYIDESPSKRC